MLPFLKISSHQLCTETPVQIMGTSSIAWFNVASGSQLSGSKIVGLLDLSGNGRHLNEIGTGLGGTYEAAGMNGQPSVLFNGITEALINSGTLGDLVAGGSDRGFYVICAAQWNTINAGNPVLWSAASNSTTNPFMLGFYVASTANKWRMSKRDAATSTGFGTSVTSSFAPNTRLNIFETFSNGIEGDIRINKASIANGYQGQNVSTLGSLNRFALGALVQSSGSSFANVRVSDFFVCSTNPTVDQRRRLLRHYSKYLDRNYAKTWVAQGSSTTDGKNLTDLSTSWPYRLFGLLTGSVNSEYTVVVVAQAGNSSFQGLPSGTPTQPGRDAVDPANNITLALSYDPDVLIVNYPGGDIGEGFPEDEYMANLHTFRRLGNNQGSAVWIATTQPNNAAVGDNTERKQIRDRIISEFGTRSLDFWTPLASGSLIEADPTLMLVDGTHPNPAGTSALLTLLISKEVHRI